MITLNFQDVMGFAFIFFALVLLLHTLWNILSAIDSRRWATADGVIISSKVEETADAEAYRLTRTEVIYRFQVAEQEITGHRTCFGDTTATSFPFLARRIFVKYSFGQAVAGRYDPMNPQDCVLEPGVSAYLVIQMFVGCLFFALGLAALLWAG